MDCSSRTIAGLTQECLGSMGGVQKVWLYAGDAGATVSDSSNMIETITHIADFKSYWFRKNTASMNSTLTVDTANGVSYWNTELSMVFSRMDTTKRIEVQALVMTPVSAIVLDANGKYWYLGYDNLLEASAATSESGTQKGDGNRYNITLTDESVELPYEVAKVVTDQLPE